jgi:hypothetical protein
MSAKTKVTNLKTKTALRQETYNPRDLKHDLHCGFVELGESVSVSQQHWHHATIGSKTPN